MCHLLNKTREQQQQRMQSAKTILVQVLTIGSRYSRYRYSVCAWHPIGKLALRKTTGLDWCHCACETSRICARTQFNEFYNDIFNIHVMKIIIHTRFCSQSYSARCQTLEVRREVIGNPW